MSDLLDAICDILLAIGLIINLYRASRAEREKEILEKENAELRDLVFETWMSQTERYNPDISQDIKTQWESSYMYKLLKEQVNEQE